MFPCFARVFMWYSLDLGREVREKWPRTVWKFKSSWPLGTLVCTLYVVNVLDQWPSPKFEPPNHLDQTSRPRLLMHINRRSSWINCYQHSVMGAFLEFRKGFCIFTPGTVFGCPLEELFSPGELEAPPIVIKCTQELEERGKLQGKHWYKFPVRDRPFIFSLLKTEQCSNLPYQLGVFGG